MGGLLLLVLTPILAVALLGGRDADPGLGAASGASDSVGPTAGTSTAPSGTGTPGPAPGSPTPHASADPSALAVDSIVATAVERLSVRSAPSVDAERLGSVELGSAGFVVDGPVVADGLRWYLLSALGLPPNTGCAGTFVTDPYSCPVWFGWLAGTSESGEAWLVGQRTDCPNSSSIEDFALARTALERLACFGADSFTFRGWWPEVPDDAGLGGACVAQGTPSGWLLCQNVNYNGVTTGQDQGFGGIGVSVSINPATDVAMPPRGTWIELHVHLDDPAAQACGEDAVGALTEERTPEAWVVFCRSQMVVESVQAVDGP